LALVVLSQSTAGILRLTQPDLCSLSPVIGEALVAFDLKPAHVIRADAPIDVDEISRREFAPRHFPIAPGAHRIFLPV
jgi:hypothetical protein